MDSERIKEIKNSIIDCVNFKSIDFGNNLVDYAFFLGGLHISSVDDFMNAFNEGGKFLYWVVKQIISYKRSYQTVLKENTILRDMCIVLKYERGTISFKKCFSLLNSSLAKVLASVLYVTNKIKNKQEVDAYYIFGPFIYENAFSYYDLSAINERERSFLVRALNDVGDFSILEHNLFKRNYPISDSFAKTVENIELKKYLNWNHCFPKPVTIEEKFVSEMFAVKYEFDDGKNKLHECMNFGTPWPDVREWSYESLNKTKVYFSNQRIDIITNLICFILYGRKLTFETEKAILDASTEFFTNPTQIIYPIVEFAYHNKSKLSKDAQKQLVALSLSRTDSLSDIQIIENLKEAGVILHKNCMDKLRSKNETVISKAKVSSDENEFKRLLIPDAYDEISLEDLEIISKQFEKYSRTSTDPSLYIQYLRVLDRVKQVGKVDITWVSQEIIRAIYRWQNVGYSLSSSKLITHQFNGPSVSFKDADSYFKQYFRDPRLPFFAQLGFDDKRVFESLKRISEGSLTYFANTLILSKDYPYYKTDNNPMEYDENKLLDSADDFEKVVYPFFHSFIRLYGHRLLNHYSPFFFMRAFFENYQYYVMPIYFLKNKRKRIFNYIKRKRPNGSYCRYSEKPTYSDLTQLFPLLEKEVLYTGTKYAISPINTSKGRDFAKPVSPAEVLLKLIDMILKNTDSLYLASDFVSIYVIMYYRKNMNIRNSVIHGNNYPYPPEVIDAHYTLTLLCIADLIKRNDNFDKGKDW